MRRFHLGLASLHTSELFLLIPFITFALSFASYVGVRPHIKRFLEHSNIDLSTLYRHLKAVLLLAFIPILATSTFYLAVLAAPLATLTCYLAGLLCVHDNDQAMSFLKRRLLSNANARAAFERSRRLRKLIA